MNAMWPAYAGAGKAPLYPTFNSQRGYSGADWPMQMQFTPEACSMLVDAGNEGLYAGYHDCTSRHCVAWTFELKPGFWVPDGMGYGTVPKSGTIAGEPVRTEFRGNITLAPLAAAVIIDM